MRFEAITGGRGRHILFEHPGGHVRCGAGKFGRGLDLKADGGYIVAEPSNHISGGTYDWDVGHHPEDLPLSRPPAWLLEQLQADNVVQLATGDDHTIPEGKRNAHLTSLAGTMRHRGMSPEAIIAALVEDNHQRCAPPLQEGEVRKIAESVSRYPAGADETRAVPVSDELGGEIERLAQLSSIEYDRCRQEEARRLSVRVATLDSEVEKRR